MNAPALAANHFADKLHARGSSVMFIQDEGGIFQTEGWTHSLLAKHRAEYIRGRRLSCLCTWGERQKEVLARHGVASAHGIAVTGCPRFDLCSPRYGWMKNAAVTEALADRRPYILMCTRFTSVAHLGGLDRLFRLRDKAETLDLANRRLSTWQRDAHDFIEFVVLVGEIARAYPDYDIILRPHPSESAAFYESALEHYETVTVTRKGSALDWIRSAELVIHTNCTTGVEAVLADRRVLNMRPDLVPRGAFDKEVAKEAGVSANSIRDAVEKAGVLLRAPPPAQAWSAQAHAILANLKTDAVPMLADETLKVLREEQIDSSRVVLPPRDTLRELVRPWVRRWRKRQTLEAAYVAAKRGQIDAEHVERVVDGYRLEGRMQGRIRHMTQHYVVVDPT